MNSVGLFSGLGVTALALGSKFGGTIAHLRVFCDICRFSRKILAERVGQGHFGHRSNEVRICDDVATLVPHSSDGVIDLVTGGWPGQDLSGMDKRAGLTGARNGLFHHVLRVADAYGATWAFLENVSDVCANGLNLVVGALEEKGFDCRWQGRSASSLGAPHERNRFFLLAKRRGGTATAVVKLQTTADVMQAARRWGWHSVK